MAVISIEGMIFRAHIGYYDAEKLLGNEIEVSVKLEVATQKAESTDKLEETIDYEDVYDLVREAVAEPMNLLETAVKKITNKIAGEYPSIKRLQVRIAKLNPPMKGRVKKVWVEDFWRRDLKK
ncbi:MAG: dihydroneopterin aldolase [Chitinophagales bacterium]